MKNIFKPMSYPIFKLVFDRNHRANSNKEGSIELRITYNRKQRYITTGIRVLPKQWKNGSIVNRLDAFEMQNALDMFVTQCRKKINEELESGRMDMRTIVPTLNGEEKRVSSRNAPKQVMLLDYIRQRFEVRKYGKKNASQEMYERFYRFMEKWNGMMALDDITEVKIIEMDNALGNMKAASKWNHYHRFLNMIITDAMNEGLMSRNPYKCGLKISHGGDDNGIDKYLTKVEFDKLANYQPEDAKLERVRDLFIFQTYTCMAYVDLAAFDVNSINIINGKPMYSGRREKTGQEFIFMIMPEAMAILDKYDNELPIISNQKYNDYLEVLCHEARIRKVVTSHWARHTGAMLLLNAGVDIEVVAKILGHANTKVTRETYAKLLDTTVADAMAKVKI